MPASDGSKDFPFRHDVTAARAVMALSIVTAMTAMLVIIESYLAKTPLLEGTLIFSRSTVEPQAGPADMAEK